MELKNAHRAPEWRADWWLGRAFHFGFRPQQSFVVIAADEHGNLILGPARSRIRNISKNTQTLPIAQANTMLTRGSLEIE